MRGAKLSTLLHNSAECPNVKSCSVTVHFEAIAIEGEKEKIRFSITRIAFPDNSSHYKINEKQVSLKDVTKLLREYGVDLDHSRYLILQVCARNRLPGNAFTGVTFAGRCRIDCDDETDRC